jgi:hypothetical protein
VYADIVNEDYFEGMRAARAAARQARGPCKPAWCELRPAWACEPGWRAYCWYYGFFIEWNYRSRKRRWPAWTRLRIVVRGGLPGDGEACEP